MSRFLVIGANGVAGSAGIRAIRECFGSDAQITGVWYGRKQEDLEIDGVDTTIFGDILDEACIDEIVESSGNQFDWCLYATALGDVGFPVLDATAEQIASSNRLSFDPLLALEERFEIGTIVAYSTFYSLGYQKITYGAMGHSKQAIEDWALIDGKSGRRCLRAGAFRSGSSQGIKLLIRRRAKELAQSNNAVLRGLFENQKPSVAVEKMEQAVFEEERQIYGDTGTDEEGLYKAHLKIFAGANEPFVNVCGQRIWLSGDPQEIN